MDKSNNKQVPMGNNNEDDGGEDGDSPKNWVGILTELRYAKLGPRGWYKKLPHLTADDADDEGPSLFIPGPGKAAIADVPMSHWSDIRSAFTQKLLLKYAGWRKGRGDPTAPGVPGGPNNWVPIGPAAVRQGPATGNPPISGRALRIAIAPGESRVYVASAEGGVWRSDDVGANWRSLMDNFDVITTSYASTSLSCGAIAIDPSDPDRIYVGTGEADTYDFFSSRLLNALPTYDGIGPIRSDDGGNSWNVESAAPGSPQLMGSAFFELAVDPSDRDNVLAATTVGLFRRESDGTGGYYWTQKRTGVHSSVVVCQVSSGSAITFYAAARNSGVYSSSDNGNTWTSVGTGFPSTAERISLGARPTDPNTLYAFAEASNNPLGVFRLDGGSGQWRSIANLPSLSAGNFFSYSLAIAVDPNNSNLIYLASTTTGSDASIFRCAIQSSGSGGALAYSMTSTFIGTGVHADVHALTHAPGDSATLWVCCDGGVWRNPAANGSGIFQPHNAGLATLAGNFFSQHPTQPAVILLGFQDNGTARYTGEECWTHIFGGDGGYPIINWRDPNKVIVYADGVIYSALDGGRSFTTLLNTGWPVFVLPVVTTPYNPGSPSDAEVIACGAGTSLFISNQFGADWAVTTPTAVATFSQNIFSLTFASPTTIYVGTVLGEVFRVDHVGTSWNQTQLDNASAGPLGLSGLITDIEIDPADSSHSSIYITFSGYGAGDYRHVWHFDGTRWESRSGSGTSALLDVEYNAIVADPSNTSTLYVGGDLGVYRSTNAGASWAPFQDGLPDAAVFDMQIHPTTRLLRASTSGRGMFELKLDPPSQVDVELYVRDTSLDVGRSATVDGLPDPETWPSQPVKHYQSRNIKVDVPTSSGYQTPTTAIDFVVFNDVIVDGSANTATNDGTLGTVVNRVYVEVHNRGIVPANVNVVLLLANASMGLPSLPAGFQSNVQNGTTITTADWATVGIKQLTNLRSVYPQVVPFNLPSTMLPPPSDLPGKSHYCLLALVSSPQDSLTDSQQIPDYLVVADRKVALRNLHVVAFTGPPPPPGGLPINGRWQRLDLFGYQENEQLLKELVIDARLFDGRFMVLLPPDLEFDEAGGLEDCEHHKPLIEKWAKTHAARLWEFIEHGRFSYQACRQMIYDIRYASGGLLLLGECKKEKTFVLSGLSIQPRKRYPIFIYFEPLFQKGEESLSVDVTVRNSRTKLIEGGSTYSINLIVEKSIE